MRAAFVLLTFAVLVPTGAQAGDPSAPPAAMDALDLGETAQHAAGRMPGVPSSTEPKKRGNAQGYARGDYVPDDVLRDRGFNAVQTVQQQVGFGTGNDVGREGRDVKRELEHEKHEEHQDHQEKDHDKGHGDGEGHGHGDGNGHHH